MNDAAKPYAVNLCGAHPDDDGFDHCWTGDEYATLAEAREVFDAKNPIVAMAASVPNPATFAAHYHDVPFVWLSGPETHEIRKLREPKPVDLTAEDEEWRREIAMEAGMLHGVDAYNEVMGYD